LIVGIDHGLQLKRETSDSPQLTAQKEQLEALLRGEIPKRKVQFISEESDPQKTTIARALAEATNPRIPWINIKMNEEERTAAGIKEALEKRPGHPDYDTVAFRIESRIPEDLVRESFFIDQTLQAAKDAESILMLWVISMSTRLREAIGAANARGKVIHPQRLLSMDATEFQSLPLSSSPSPSSIRLHLKICPPVTT
jgi:hypothetical protein